MTFKELQDEVVDAQFSEGRRAKVKLWLNLRYAQAWNAHDWAFAYATTAVGTSGSGLSSLPSNVLRVIALNDEYGSRVDYMTPYEFSDVYRDTTASTGRPGNFTVVGGTVVLGPSSDQAYTNWTLYYRKRYTALAVDADVPSLPVDYHYMLVHGALATGLALNNDPTWETHERLWEALVQSMTGAYANDWAGTMQFQADTLG